MKSICFVSTGHATKLSELTLIGTKMNSAQMVVYKKLIEPKIDSVKLVTPRFWAISMY